MKTEKILFALLLIFLTIFSQAVFSIPPHPIRTTSITTPSSAGNAEKVIEVNFSINKDNQVILNSLSIKNLPQAVISPTSSDYYLEITDSDNHSLFKSNILVVFDPNTNISPEYYAIPYPNGAKYLNFYYQNSPMKINYQNSQLDHIEIPQESFISILDSNIVFYVIGAIGIIIVLIAIYFISKKYTIKI
jgi:hypothetical protein